MAVETTTLVRYYEATVTQGGAAGTVELRIGGVTYTSAADDSALSDALHAGAAMAMAVTAMAATASPLAATFVSFPWSPPTADDQWWLDPATTAKALGIRTAHQLDGVSGDPVRLVAGVLLGEQQQFHMPREPWPGYADQSIAQREAELARRFGEAAKRDVNDYARALVAAVANFELVLQLSGQTQSRAVAEAFAAELLDQPVVPIEESPLSGAALAQLLERVPHAAGAIVGSAAADGDPMLMLITMPTGMIVFGAAAGVAKALNTGLRAKILRWMNVPDPLQLRGSGMAATPEQDSPPDSAAGQEGA